MSFEKGNVIKVSTIYANHQKICVVVGKNERRREIAVVFINSNPRRGNKAKNQIHLLRKGRAYYLNYDSYVDCGEIMILDIDLVSNDIDFGSGKYIGTVSEADLNLFSSTLQSADTIEPIKKVRFGLLSKN